MIDTVKTDIIAGHPNGFIFAATSDDIEHAHKQHKIAALMGVEGGHAIEDSLRLLRDYYALGVRYMTLALFQYQRLGRLAGRASTTQRSSTTTVLRPSANRWCWK